MKNLNFSFAVVALSIMVFSIFLLMVLVILSLLVTIFFLCSVVAYDLGAGSILRVIVTIFTEFFILISVLFGFLFDFLNFALILHFLL